MMNKVSRYLSRFSFLIALLFLTGCNTATLTIKATNASALKSFQTQSWLTPKANNKNASLFITVDTTNKKFTISLTQGGTVLTTELSDTNIASNTLFNYIVTPGTNMQAMDSYGALLWCNPDETNTPIHYRFIDMNATAKDNMLVGTTQSIANSQTTFETTGISLGCSANLILAAWNGNYSGMLSYGSKYAKANPTTHSFDTPMECFGYPAAGYTPLAPLAYVSSNGQYAIAQGSKSTTDTYGTIQAGIFNGNFWEGSLGTIMNPLSGYAPITLSASSDNLSDGSLYLLISNHLPTEPSQYTQDGSEYKILYYDNDAFGLNISTPSTLSTTQVYQLSIENESDFKNKPVTYSNNTDVIVMMSEIAQSTVNNSTGFYYLFMNKYYIENPNSNMALAKITGDFSSDVSGVNPDRFTTTATISIDAFAQNANWITFLTSASPTRVIAYNTDTSQLVLDQEIADFAVTSSQITVSKEGVIVMSYTDESGNVYSKTLSVGDPISVPSALRKFSPLKYQKTL